MNDELQKMRSLLAKLGQNSECVYWLSNPDFSQLIYVSPAYEKIWGCTAESLYQNPRSWLNFLHPDDKLEDYHPLQAMLERIQHQDAKARYEENYRIIRPDGEVRWVLAQGSPLFDESGQLYGISGIAIDVTRAKIEEEALKISKERAEAADQAKSELLAMISHELRAPLTGVIGMAQLLAVDCLLPAQREQVEDIQKASDHLLTLVNDLLDLNRLESGEIELRPAPLNLRHLIEDVFNIVAFQAKVKNLEILVNYPGDVPSQIIGDARALQQVILNLLQNAIKFTEQGCVIVTVNLLKSTNQQVLLELIVKDTGVGISPDKLSTILECFKQTNTASLRRYGGLGVGLTLSKAYVEVMGGYIEADSQPLQGSAFSCTLPFDLQKDSGAAAEGWAALKSQLRILIVDDSLQGEILLKYIGSGPLAQLCTAEEALGVLAAARQRNAAFDMVIVDQQLSSADAIQLGVSINNQAAATHKAMLLLLMPPSPITAKERAKAAGYFDCLIKPIHSAELLTELTAVWQKWQTKLHAVKKNTTSEPASRLRVLLVEDSPIVQRVHIKMLQQLGCKVDLAENAAQAITMSENNYDVIFMDVGLPGISGIEVTKAIRRHEDAKKHTPIIAITGYGHVEDKQNCLAAGMDDVATKPIKVEQLEEILEKWGKRSNEAVLNES